MWKVLVWSRKRRIGAGLALLLFIGGGAAWYGMDIQTKPTGGLPDGERVIHMVTGEFKSTTAEGQTLESYRWDPGTIFIEKGERIKLVLYGVNGESHPFYIEGTDIRGEVKKGKETVVHFQSEKEGTYRLICLTHPDKDHNGPMIGYLVVD